MAVHFTTSAKVKEALGGTVGGASGLIDTFIAGVTAAFANRLKRHVEQVARTELYSLRPGQRIVSLRGSPITAIASLKFSAVRDFDAATAQDDSLYYARLNDPDRFLLHLDSPQAIGIDVLQVVYTAGMGVNTAAVMTAFPELAQQATLECVNLYQRRTSQSTLQTTSAADSEHFRELKFSKITDEVLAANARQAYAH